VVPRTVPLEHKDGFTGFLRRRHRAGGELKKEESGRDET
jgi:hypothetical protein